MPHRINLDDLIKEAVHEQIRNPVSPVSSSEAWRRLNIRMRGSGRKPARKYALAASMFIMLLGVVLFRPSEGMAFTKITEIFHQIHGTVTEIFGSTADPVDSHAPEAPPKGAGGFDVVHRRQLAEEDTGRYTLAEAREMASFAIQVPARVPNGFVFSHANVMKSDRGESGDVYLTYEERAGREDHGGQGGSGAVEDREDHGGQGGSGAVGDRQDRGDQGAGGGRRTFTIRETNVLEGLGLGVTVNNEDTRVSELKLNDWEASLLQFKDGSLELFWLTSTRYNSIKGKLTVDEAKMIALSLQ